MDEPHGTLGREHPHVRRPLLKVDVSIEEASSQDVVDAVLISAHVCMVLVVVAKTFALMGSKWAARVQQRDEPAPRSHAPRQHIPP